MSRPRPDYPSTTWDDVAQCIPAWEREYGVSVAFRLVFRDDLKEGGYVECVISDGRGLSVGQELTRVRQLFHVKRHGSQAGNVLHCAFEAFVQLKSTPWQWSTKMRRDNLP